MFLKIKLAIVLIAGFFCFQAFASVGGIRQVVAGGDHVYALAYDSTIWTWGSWIAKPYQFSSNKWTKLYNGENHFFAQALDGSIWGWGKNEYTQIIQNYPSYISEPVLVSSEQWIDIQGGQSFTVGIKADSSMWFWGRNESYELGLDNSSPQVGMVRPNNDKWLQAAPSAYDGVALRSDSTVWGWGDGNDWSLVKDQKFAKIRSGFNGHFALSESGDLYSWGSSQFGELGTGINTNNKTPWLVGLNRYTDVSSGIWNTIILGEDSLLYALGEDFSSSNVSTDNSYLSPTLVSNKKFKAIEVGYRAGFAIEENGGLYSWGIDSYEQLGNSSDDDQMYPTPIYSEKISRKWPYFTKNLPIDFPTFSLNLIEELPLQFANGFKKIRWSRRPNLCKAKILNDSSIEVSSISGAHGTDTLGIEIEDLYGRKITEKISLRIGSSPFGPLKCTKIQASFFKTSGICDNGKLYVWGFDDSILPAPKDNSRWLSFSVAGFGGLGIKADSSLWAWGSNTTGQLGLPEQKKYPDLEKVGSEKWLKVVTNLYATIAIQSDSSLWGFGINGNAELGIGSAQSSLLGSKINESKWIDVAMGDSFAVGIQSDSSLWVWGRNDGGVLGDVSIFKSLLPIQMGSGTKWKMVSAYYETVAALDFAGHLWVWGTYPSNPNTGSFDFVANAPVQMGNKIWKSVSAGDDFIVLLAEDSTRWGMGKNGLGNLGDGDSSFVGIIRQLDNYKWIQATAGNLHFAGIRSDSVVMTSGLGCYGQLGTNQVSNFQWGLEEVPFPHRFSIVRNNDSWLDTIVVEEGFSVKDVDLKEVFTDFSGSTLMMSIPTATQLKANYSITNGVLHIEESPYAVSGFDSIVVKVANLNGDEIYAPIWIQYVPKNYAPQFTSIDTVWVQDCSDFSSSLIPFNATDVNNDSLFLYFLDCPECNAGTVSLFSRCARNVNLSVAVSDGKLLSNERTLTIHVESFNTVPEAKSPRPWFVKEDTEEEFPVSYFKASDLEGDKLFVRVEDASGVLKSYFAEEGVFYPKANWNGILKVKASVCDKHDCGETFDWVIGVIPVQDAPKFEIATFKTMEMNGRLPVEGDLGICSDVDGDSCSLFALPGDDYSLDGDDIVPKKNYTGRLYVNMACTDGRDTSNTAQLSVTVTRPAGILKIERASEKKNWNWFDLKGRSGLKPHQN